MRRVRLILLVLGALSFLPAWSPAQGMLLFEKAEDLLSAGNQELGLARLTEAFGAFEKEADTAGMVRTSLRLGYVQLSRRATADGLVSYRRAADLARAAGRTDDYRQALDALSTTYFLTGRLEEAAPLLQEGMQLADRTGDRKQYSSQMVQLGYTYFQLGRLDSARLLLNEALEQKRRLDDTTGITLAVNYLGLFYYRLGDYERAQEYYLETLQRKETARDSAGIALMLKNLSNLFIDLGEWDKAEDYARRGYELADYLGLTVYKSENLVNLAIVERQHHRPEAALTIYQEIIALHRTAGNTLRLAESLLAAGNIHLAQNHFERAAALFGEAHTLAGQSGDLIARIDVLLSSGDLELQRQRPTAALPYLTEAAALAEQNRLQPKLRQAARYLTDAYEQLDQPSEALRWHRRYASLQDSFYRQEQQKTVFDLETRYQVAEKEKQIDLLHARNELQELRLQQARRRQLLLFAGLAALALIAGLAAFAFRTKQKAGRELAAKNALISRALQEKELLLREIHHRVKNNLQVISGLLRLQSLHLSDRHAQEALREGRRRVQSMALIHQNLYQEDNLTGVNARDYVQKLTEALFNTYNILPDRIELTTDIETLNIDIDTAIPLGLILNELISNALKHAFPGERAGILEVSLREEAGQLRLRVRDNGVGMGPDTQLRQRSSFGFQLVEMLAEKLDAHLSVDNRTGTSVQLNIQNYHLA